MAEKSETTIQIPSINQKPLIIFIPNIYKIKATIKPVTFESQIADQDFLNQISVASGSFLPKAISSLILSKINIFASIAIPTERINQAIEARVKTVQVDFTIAKTITIYIAKATEETNPDNL
jgi:hypothetical protein